MDWPKLFAQATVVAFLLCINSLLVMLCWNYFVVPTILGIKEVDFITAMGLHALVQIMFNGKGFTASMKE
jgi:hypothetical protein